MGNWGYRPYTYSWRKNSSCVRYLVFCAHVGGDPHVDPD